MRKRKSDNCQSKQLKILKFFHRTVDIISDEKDSSKSIKVSGECSNDCSISISKNNAAEETHSNYFSHKSTACVTPKRDRLINVSPSKDDNVVFTPKDGVKSSDCSSDDILPPTPKIIKSKLVTGLSRFTKTWNLNGTVENTSIKRDVSDHLSSKDNVNSKDHIFSVNCCTPSKILSAKEVVNQDNLSSSNRDKLAFCESQNEQPQPNLDYKENESFGKKISSHLVTNKTDHRISSTHPIGSVDSNISFRERISDITEPKIKFISELFESKNEAHECKDELQEHFEDLSFEDWDLQTDDQILDHKIEHLQLDSVKRCKVVSISEGPGNYEKTLVLSSTKTKQTAKCLLQGVWAMATRIAPGDVISIRCNRKIQGVWILGGDNQKSFTKELGESVQVNLEFLVENPDMLISGTSVVGSLFCPRKSVLASRFRGFEASGPPPLLMNGSNIYTDSSSTEVGIVDTKVQNSARIMLIGSLVHQLLQTSLLGNLHNTSNISKAAHEILHCHKTAGDMYAAQVELYDVKKEVLNFVPSVSRFMQKFVEGCCFSTKASGLWGKGENMDEAREWKGSICAIKDIEENLWVPSLGLKGKVDVTVQVKIHPKSQKGNLNKEKVKEMPLELKTGRSSYSPEHQGQVLLYCMMMSALAAEKGAENRVIDSGLLLYLREESMREICAGKYEMQDLMLLRNDLAHFLTCGPLISNEEGLDLLNVKRSNIINPSSFKISMSLPELPEPINHRKACSNCPYLTICSAHLQCSNSLDSISKNHPMSLLAPKALKHLKPTHLDYFVHWSCLIGIEYQDCLQESKDHFLWTKEPLEREKQGRCLSHLVVTEVKYVSGKELELSNKSFVEGHIHSMLRAETFNLPLELVDEKNPTTATCASLQTLTFNVGERVLISSDERIALSSGTVVSLTPNMLCLCFDRDLTSRYGKGQFHVDKYDYLSTSSAFSLTSLGLLLEDNWSANRLRELVIDRREPDFFKKLNRKVLSECSSVLKELNHSQVRAVLRALSAKDYLLVRGLPGTGKTATIVAMIQVFVAMGLSVLLTGHSHSSVDNVMLRLVDQGLGNSLLRLGGSASQIHVDLKPYTESTLTEHCQSPQDLEKVYHSKVIVGVTCMGSGHPLLCSRAFDVCILDEAGQVLLPVSLRPIMSAKVFILVGDPEQLPPVVRGHHAKILGLQQTLFNTLDSSKASVTLNLQYRMNSVITKLANNLSYGSRLICANDKVANAIMHIPRQKEIIDQYCEDKWLHATIAPEINYSVIFLDTGNTVDLVNKDFYPKEMETNSLDGKAREHVCKYTNISEAAIIYYIVKALLLGGVETSKIGVIAPFRDQVALLKNILSNVTRSVNNEIKNQFVEVNTVDQFQGRDKEIVLYSFTRSGNVSAEDSKSKDLELLSNKHRLTVAITRAKQKLICIGNVEMLKTYNIIKDFISFIPENNMVNVLDGKNGFNWCRIFSSIDKQK